MRIYLAGPLFSTAEREFNARLAVLLRAAGHEVWLPQERQGRTAAATFRIDVRGIGWADVVVAGMDGPDPDSGTCWECGYAYGKKPVIAYRTDFRVGEEPGKGAYNLMLTVSATRSLLLPLAGAETVARRVTRALAALPRRRQPRGARGGRRSAIPPTRR
jgi:nucleoside 2-deoxyribosyltransferase